MDREDIENGLWKVAKLMEEEKKAEPKGVNRPRTENRFPPIPGVRGRPITPRPEIRPGGSNIRQQDRAGPSSGQRQELPHEPWRVTRYSDSDSDSDSEESPERVTVPGQRQADTEGRGSETPPRAARTQLPTVPASTGAVSRSSTANNARATTTTRGSQPPTVAPAQSRLERAKQELAEGKKKLARENVECHNCGEKGHLKRECTLPELPYCRTCKNLRKSKDGKVYICPYWRDAWHKEWVRKDREKKREMEEAKRLKEKNEKKSKKKGKE